ncbi:hypothetical protein THOE12_20325 [Vibrio rotiferianus]|nr:hypothetical protein THOE12_20325 [Vibrio rotiferianus]
MNYPSPCVRLYFFVRDLSRLSITFRTFCVLASKNDEQIYQQLHRILIKFSQVLFEFCQEHFFTLNQLFTLRTFPSYNAVFSV